jgi:fumarate reductase flavoprotein subunit
MHVIVVGGGNAGLIAAIHAADGGARVTIVEKTGQLGGALWFTSHMISGAGSRAQARKGIVDTPDLFYDDIWKIGRGKSDPEILRYAAENSGAAVDWLEDIGVEWTEQSPYITYAHDPYSAARTLTPVPYKNISGSGPGRAVYNALMKQIDERRAAGTIDVLFRCKAERLVAAADGSVSGVEVTDWQGTRVLEGDAVIMATGSYAANFDMLAKYNAEWDHLITITPPHATGDGLVMGEAIGAQLVNMDMMVLVVGGVEDPRSPGICVYWILGPTSRPPGQSGDIWVNRHGERFVREDEPIPSIREDAIMAQPGTELYLVMDQPMRDGLTEAVTAATERNFEGRTPNLLMTANTIEELAIQLGLPPATLRATVDEYNAAVESGNDRLGRAPEAMPKKIDTAPFHGVCTVGTLFLTHGGLKINSNGQVIRTDGTAIPNLFAAGDVMGAGQVMGESFAGGQGVGVAATFGILAGRNAARAKVLAG